VNWSRGCFFLTRSPSMTMVVRVSGMGRKGRIRSAKEVHMPQVSLNYFRAAAIFLLVGVAMGLQMSISGEHNVTGAHAHLTLVGGVTSAIFGTYFALEREKAKLWWAALHFWIVVVSSAVMAGALYLLLLGFGAMAPLVAAGSFAYAAGVAMFVWIVFSPEPNASALPGPAHS
jgi:hypothetical protein